MRRTQTPATDVPKTHLRRFAMKTTIQKILCSAALLTIGLVGAGAALAVQAATIKVSLSGLDLTTSEGMSAARERVHQVARTACREVSDDMDLSHRENYLKCVDEAMARALPWIEAIARRNATSPSVVRNAN
jgi:UrcA family protein